MYSFLRGMLIVWIICLFIFSLVASAILVSWVADETNWLAGVVAGIFILSIYGGLVAWLNEPNVIKIRLGRKQ